MDKLRIAVQKSGRLSDECKKLFKNCGIKVNLKTESLLAIAENMPIEILKVRDDDIPGLVFDGVVDLGIVGENVLQEKALKNESQNQANPYIMLKQLGFGNCRLSIAAPTDSNYKTIQDLAGKRIATTYPNILKQYLTNMNIDANIYLLTGSVEVAPRSGLADAICDLVSSGATLEANGLVEIQQIMQSTACLIQQKQPLSTSKQELVDKLLLRIDGIMQAQESKYIMLHCPKDKLEQIVSLLPGVEKPTILSLASDTTKIALHMVSRENLFWETMEELKALGASSILVLPIEKMLV